MPTDLREQIIQHILGNLQGLPGIVNVFRDRKVGQPLDTETNTPMLPAAIFLDGRERSTQPSTWGHGLRPGRVPAVPMIFEPQIYIILMPRQDIENTGVAAEMASWRMLVLNAMLNDQALMILLGSEGDIHLSGIMTDMGSGYRLQGELRFDFEIKYMLNPDDLM